MLNIERYKFFTDSACDWNLDRAAKSLDSDIKSLDVTVMLANYVGIQPRFQSFEVCVDPLSPATHTREGENCFIIHLK